MLSVPTAVPSNSMSHLGSEQLANKVNGNSGYVELIKLLLPGEKGKEGKTGVKKLHRYGSKVGFVLPTLLACRSSIADMHPYE